MHYEIYGLGKPLVLIHGGGSSIRYDYREIIPRLQDRFQLIGIDLQNHGKSDHRDIPETFEQDADDVVGLLRELHIERAFFWGFSNGGNTVLQIAHRHPTFVDKLVVASAFFKREGMVDGFFENMQQATLADMPLTLRANFLDQTPNEVKLQNLFEKDRKRMQTFEDWSPAIFNSITCPTLFICGDHDVMKPEHVIEMWRLVPKSRLLILPATHGSYMMADFDNHVHTTLIDHTVDTVVTFLQE
ncbi:alpha/beta fold hydrolase [Sphingobacterium suaedae]|uniref:Alpha/beta fold hydrolase n=1 Tax=Sphingobacterium suaedae TaxID=1686402 RepID=A0ABW5KDX2_9SPHI